jgi:protein-S-isoprenylcysteine O-methyltransferase Ste14
MKRDNLAALLHALTSLVVISLGFWVEPRLPLPRSAAKPLGMAIFLLGMALFAWVLAHLKGAFFGNVTPVTNHLVTSGPYRQVRHPLYLSMIVALLGLAVALRGLWGVVGVCILFGPAAAYRARLEEKALARKFGPEWDAYTRQTRFMLPLIW